MSPPTANEVKLSAVRTQSEKPKRKRNTQRAAAAMAATAATAAAVVMKHESLV